MSNLFNIIKQKVSIVDIAKRYNIDLKKSGRGMYSCKCCFHSEDTSSMVFYETTNSYYCFGASCNSSGDLINFVASKEGISNYDACIRIAEWHGINVPHLDRREEEKVSKYDRYKAILTAATDYYVSNMKDDIYTMLFNTWGITKETANRFRLGYAPNELGLLQYLESKVNITKKEMFDCGLFHSGGSGEYFKGRIIIPFIKGSKTFYMSGRATPWTPKTQYEYFDDQAGNLIAVKKYRNLPKGEIEVENAYFNDDIIRTVNDEPLIITEGLMDCIRLHQASHKSITSGGTNIKEELVKKLIPLKDRAERIIVCFDTDSNMAGQNAAMELAEKLNEFIESVNVLELPFGADGNKVDVCSYLLEHPESDFYNLLKYSKTVVEQHIKKLPDFAEMSITEEIKLLKPILKLILKADEVTRESYIDLLHEKTGKTKQVIKKALKGMVQEEKKTGETHINFEQPLKSILDNIRGQQDTRLVDIAEVTYMWICSNGGQFFVDPTFRSYLFYQDSVFMVDPDDSAFCIFMCEIGDFNYACSEGRYVFEHLKNLAGSRGKKIQSYSWEYTDAEKGSIFISLNNEKRDILKMSEQKTEIMPNGLNEYNVLLSSDKAMKPINYTGSENITEGRRLIKELIYDNLTCKDTDKYMALSWFMSYPFIQFAQTKPQMRFEGNSESGKSTAAKLLTAMIYSEHQLKASTTAANYSSAARSPFACLDNIEQRELTNALSQFFLTTSTGITKEKRKAGTDSDTVTEKANCLILTTGIESLKGSELISRMLILQFSKKYHKPDFMETSVLNAIKTNHSLFFATMVDIWVNQVLPKLKSPEYAEKVAAIRKIFRGHSKTRSYEYVSIMLAVCESLMEFLPKPTDITIEELSAIKSETGRSAAFSEWFNDPCVRLMGSWIVTQDVISAETQMHTNSTSILFDMFYDHYVAKRKLLDSIEATMDDILCNLSMKCELESLGGEDNPTMVFTFTTTANNLFATFSKLARFNGLPTFFNDPLQLQKRIHNDLNVLKMSNWYVEKVKGSGGNKYKYYKVIS